MFALDSISVELGGRNILDRVSAVVNRGETLGVVGPNGSGKTTLLRVIAGEMRPRSGRVETPPAMRIGYLAQGHASDGAQTIAEVFPAAFAADLANEQLAALAARMAHEHDSALADEYDALLERVSNAPSVDSDALRDQLRLRAVAPEIPVGQLSGGELTKLGLINLVAQAPEALLLDEPTNHLDLVGIEWVQALIAAFQGPVIVVSHDRALLDDCADAILEIDPHSGKGEVFAGNYTDYANEKARREAEAWESFRRQQREERALKRTISAIESRSRNIENRTINFYVRKRAKKVARRATTLKARLNRQIDSSEHLERPNRRPQGFYGGFQTEDAGATRLLTAVKASIAMDGKPLLSDVSFVLTKGEKLVVSGPNGCGKTTLLRAVLGQHPVASGTLSLSGSASVGYLSQADDIAPTDAGLSAVQLLRRGLAMPEAEIYNFLHRFLFGHDQVNTPVGSLSYGERRRLALARLVLGGANLLLLDEPTNHLDLPSREAFEAAFAGFEGAALIVTHDRYFIEQFADEVLDLAAFAAE